MRRRLLLALAAVGLVAPAAAPVAVAARPAARLLVYGQEWSLWPSRPSVPAGRVVVQFWNRGQDAHDLHIRRLGRGGMLVGPAQAVPVTESGQIRTATWRLRRGTYELYCSMPGHMKLGMHARLAVR